MQENTLTQKNISAGDILADLGKVLVAFSGGVDSSVLLKLAADRLGKKNVLAVTAVGALHPAREKRQAEWIARLIGVKHIFAADTACKQTVFLQNTPQRCYHCKKALIHQLMILAKEHGFVAIVAGENADDQLDYRPGSQALRELGVRCPLKEAHLTKTEIRALAKEWSLPNFDAPAGPCLATRIPYGEPITSELLSQIEQAEETLHELGFDVVRVRVHGPVARIEVDPDQLVDVLGGGMRADILSRFRKLGFTYVSLDLEGYQLGGLNKFIDRNE